MIGAKILHIFLARKLEKIYIYQSRIFVGKIIITDFPCFAQVVIQV